MIVRVAVAAVVFFLALDGGTYSLTSRHSLAIAVWWTILVGLALGLWPRRRPGAATALVLSLLAAFAVWTALSMGWAASAEKAFLEFDRAALYLGVFALAALAAAPEDIRAWCDGIALGLVGVTGVALTSRFFPDLIGESDLVRFLPDSRGRLTYPVDYWNGLGILVALAVPLLLRAAVDAQAHALRGLALAPVPAMAATIYLTSSRGATVAALLAILSFLFATARRWAAFGALLLAATGSAAAVAVLEAMPDLANAVGDAPEEQGLQAAALIVVACVATGAAYWLAARFVAWQPPRPLGWALGSVAVLALLGAIAAADPAERFEAFKRTPAETHLPEEGFVAAHLLSGGGSGRWQFWTAAVDQFREHPLQGGGAGSYEAWWAEHGSFSYFIRDAHSLYLETLAELGVVGLIFLVAALGAALAVGATALSSRRERSALAALLAAGLAYAFGAGIDWMWELTVVSVVGFACLGLLAGAAHQGGDTRTTRSRPLITAIALAAAWLVICFEALPLLTQLEIQASQAAVRRGDGTAAVEAAETARRLQPWAASPHVQLALVHEQTGALAPARRAIDDAIERDRTDWRSWLISARIRAKGADVPGARRSLARAIELNPRSALFRNR